MPACGPPEGAAARAVPLTRPSPCRPPLLHHRSLSTSSWAPPRSLPWCAPAPAHLLPACRRSPGCGASPPPPPTPPPPLAATTLFKPRRWAPWSSFIPRPPTPCAQLAPRSSWWPPPRVRRRFGSAAAAAHRTAAAVAAVSSRPAASCCSCRCCCSVPRSRSQPPHPPTHGPHPTHRRLVPGGRAGGNRAGGQRRHVGGRQHQPGPHAVLLLVSLGVWDAMRRVPVRGAWCGATPSARRQSLAHPAAHPPALLPSTALWRC